MKKETITCRCGTSREFTEPGSVKNITDAGWGVVPTFKATLVKVCPTCYSRLKEIASELFDLTGSEYISMSSLIRHSQKTSDEIEK